MSDNSSTKEAVTCAIRHIGTGVYSSGKIRIYLIQKGYSDTVATDAVKHLVATGYIDDMRASRKVLAARSGKKQESRQFIYKRLLEAGIASDCADEIIASLLLPKLLNSFPLQLTFTYLALIVFFLP